MIKLTAHFFITFLLLLSSTISFAKKGQPTFSGGLDLSAYTFFEKQETVTSGNENIFEGTFFLKYQTKLNRNVGVILDPHLDFSEFQNSRGDKFYLRAQNSGLFIRSNKTSVSAGLLSHSFGLSQLFSPLNFVDTASYWSPLTSKRISSPALRLMYKTKKLRFFASWLPKRFENIYPGDDSAWLPRQAPGSLISEGQTFLFPNPVDYSISEKEDIDGSLKNNVVVGLRIKQGPWLTQFIHYKGIDTDPTFNLDLNLTSVDITPGQEVLQVENPISARPVYQTVERTGVSLRYTLPIKWRLLYEGNISKGVANNRQGYRESQTHTGGLEWGIPLGKTLLLGVFQVYRSKNSNPSTLGLVSPFRKAYLVGANWNYKNLELSGGYFKSQSLEIELKTLEIKYKISKDFSLSANGTFLSGDLVELLSGVLDLDTVGIKASHLF